MAAQQTNVKVRIIRDCEGPGDGFKEGDEANVSAKDAELLRRRGFAVIVEQPATEKKTP